MAFETVIYEKNEEGIAYVTLNRPQVLNSFNVQMRDDLWEVFGAIKDDPEVKVVIIKGAGDRAFCAGADLSEFGTTPSVAESRRIRWERDVWGLLLHLEKPVIAAMHGFVIGSGVEIAACCDLRVASEDATFSLPEVNLGMIPAAGGTQTVPRLVPKGAAMELILLGDRINAADALRMNLVNKIVPRDALLTTAEEWARKLVAKAPIALKLAKEAVNRGLELKLDEGMLLENELYLVLQTTEDRMEGIRAFLERRKPEFKGR